MRFQVDIAKRDGDLPAVDLGSYQLKYAGFKSSQAGFNIDDYDQVFGHVPLSDSATDNNIAAARTTSAGNVGGE